jgi:hypothetical protein
MSSRRRIERLYRGHPHVRVARVHTALSTRRMLVSEYLDGRPIAEIARLDDSERDRVGEIAFRFVFGLVRRRGIAAGDPAADNLLLCCDGRVGIVDFGLLRELDADYLERERGLIRAVAERDAGALHERLAALGYLSEPAAFDPAALLEHLHSAGEWFLAPGVRRLSAEDARRTLELGDPPRSPWFSQTRRQGLPPASLLIRRIEVVPAGRTRAAARRGRLGSDRRRVLGRGPAINTARARGSPLRPRPACLNNYSFTETHTNPETRAFVTITANAGFPRSLSRERVHRRSRRRAPTSRPGT